MTEHISVGNTFKIDNALVYHVLSKILTDMDAYTSMKYRKIMQDDQPVYFDVHQ